MSEEAVSKVTAAACQLLSSAKDAAHGDDVWRTQISSLEKFGYKTLPNVEAEHDASTEPVLQPEDTAALDPVIPNYDQSEETALEYIEAKVNLL